MKEKVKSKEDLKEAMCDVRLSFRMLKEYQQKMLEVISYIKEEYAMSDLSGIRHFCHPMRGKQSGYGKLNVRKDMWAWDFLYSYEFEYYMGTQDKKVNGEDHKYTFSVLQVSDTGFYESDAPDKWGNNMESFRSVEDSASVLIFLFELKKADSDWLWKDTHKVTETRNALLSSANDTQVENTETNHFIACKYQLEDFFNKETCDEKLTHFSELVRGHCGMELLKLKSETAY
jgi:hypothetical protein